MRLWTLAEKTVSPEFSKVTSVFPVDERNLNKSEISNLQPVTILNTFPKLYGRVLKNQNWFWFWEILSMSFSYLNEKLQFCTCNYLTYIITETKINTKKFFCGGNTDFSKVIIFILYNHIVKQIAKLAINGFREKTMLYIHWYLRYCKDCALMNKTRRKFEAIISGVPQGSLLGLIFLIFSLNSIFFYSFILSLNI